MFILMTTNERGTDLTALGRVNQEVIQHEFQKSTNFTDASGSRWG